MHLLAEITEVLKIKVLQEISPNPGSDVLDNLPRLLNSPTDNRYLRLRGSQAIGYRTGRSTRA